MGIFEPFDYSKMAEESAKRLETLKVALEKIKASPFQGISELQARNARIMFLEEEIHEENINLKMFKERAKLRDGEKCT